MASGANFIDIPAVFEIRNQVQGFVFLPAFLVPGLGYGSHAQSHYADHHGDHTWFHHGASSCLIPAEAA
jgi:hypothetical protein